MSRIHSAAVVVATLFAAAAAATCRAGPPMPDTVYRGWLTSNAGPIAVLQQGPHEFVATIGDTVLERWQVAAIDGSSVTLIDARTGERTVLWFGGGNTLRAASAAEIPKPRLRWQAPAAVALESQFSVALSASGTLVAGGQATLEYDPGVLALMDATTEHEDASGRVRLKLLDSTADDYVVDLTFRAIGSQAAVARVRLAAVDLVAADGAPIALPPLDDLTIRIGPAVAALPTLVTDTGGNSGRIARSPRAHPSR